MKLGNVRNQKGFTLSEMLIALSIAAVALAGTISASVGLQKSMNAVDNYFTAHVQQIRIVDYLSRDVKRSYIVTSTGSPQTVTCTTPDYLDGSGARRTPKITMNANGATVDYRAAVSDGVLVSGSSIFTSATAGFTSADVGKALIATGIPTGTTIQSCTNSTTVVMSANATASSASSAVTIGNTVRVLDQQSIHHAHRKWSSDDDRVEYRQSASRLYGHRTGQYGVSDHEHNLPANLHIGRRDR